MSIKIRSTITVAGAGVSMSVSKSAEINQPRPIQVSVPAAKTGTLTTRTDNVSGTLTMTAGHGITTGQTLFVFWTDADGFVQHQRVTVGTVATNSVPIASGVGTNLPIATTAITACVPTEVTAAFASSDMVVLGISGTKKGAVQIRDGATIRKTVMVRVATDTYLWSKDTGEADPLNGDVATVEFANADSTASNSFNFLAGLN